MPMMTVGFYMLAVGFNMPMLIVAMQRRPAWWSRTYPRCCCAGLRQSTAGAADEPVDDRRVRLLAGRYCSRRGIASGDALAASGRQPRSAWVRATSGARKSLLARPGAAEGPYKVRIAGGRQDASDRAGFWSIENHRTADAGVYS